MTKTIFMETSNYNKPKHKKKRVRNIILIVVGVLIVIRLILPYVVLKVVNKKLSEIDGYYGHVDDIDLALIAGAYKIKVIKLEKTGGEIPVPFFAADEIRLAVEWPAIFKGKLVGTIKVEHPVLNFVKGPTEETSQTSMDGDWRDVVDDLLPLKLNSFEINNGEIHYQDFHSDPKVDVYSDNIHILAENLTNEKNDSILLPSTVVGSADIYGGSATMNMKLDALNKIPTFDFNAELLNLNLVEVNDFLKAYGNFDVQKGTFGLYIEAAAKNNKIDGYTKPIIKDLDVINWKEEKEDPLPEKLWESLVGFGGWIFKNSSEDQVATKVEFSGNLDNPDVPVGVIIGETFRNAFIKALQPALENNVNIKTVGTDKEKKDGFFDKLFDGKKE